MSEIALPLVHTEEHDEPPLILGDKTAQDVTRDVCAPMERKATPLWWAAFLTSAALMLVGLAAVTYQVRTGIGTWGLNKTVGWAFDITNFVFWVGIGHAGTLISAILFLLRQRWRTSVNRSAEAMTLFAVMCAAIFPLIHMGRPWLAFWVFPYPNTRGSLWVTEWLWAEGLVRCRAYRGRRSWAPRPVREWRSGSARDRNPRPPA